MRYVYQIHVREPLKAPFVAGRVFTTAARAEAVLLDQGFNFLPESGRWYNGIAYARVIRITVEAGRESMLGGVVYESRSDAQRLSQVPAPAGRRVS